MSLRGVLKVADSRRKKNDTPIWRSNKGWKRLRGREQRKQRREKIWLLNVQFCSAGTLILGQMNISLAYHLYFFFTFTFLILYMIFSCFCVSLWFQISSVVHWSSSCRADLSHFATVIHSFSGVWPNLDLDIVVTV